MCPAVFDVGESTPPPLHGVCIAQRYSTTREGVRFPVRRAGGSPMRDDSSYRPCYRREITCKTTTSRPDTAHPPTESTPHPQSPTHQRTDAPTSQETTQTTNDARPPRPATSRDRHERYTRRERVAHPKRNATPSTENAFDQFMKPLLQWANLNPIYTCI